MCKEMIMHFQRRPTTITVPYGCRQVIAASYVGTVVEVRERRFRIPVNIKIKPVAGRASWESRSTRDNDKRLVSRRLPLPACLCQYSWGLCIRISSLIKHLHPAVTDKPSPLILQHQQELFSYLPSRFGRNIPVTALVAHTPARVPQTKRSRKVTAPAINVEEIRLYIRTAFEEVEGIREA